MKKIWIISIMITIILGTFLSGCTTIEKKPEASSENLSSQVFFLNSILTLDIRDEGVDKKTVETRVHERIQEIEEEMSLNSSNSEITRINENSGLKPVTVSMDTFHVIEEAIKYSQLSQGAFDITVGNLVQLWGIGTDRERIPTEKEIQDALATVNYKDILLDQKNKTVFLSNKGMALDLGAIAKGYAADEISRILEEEGVKSAIINLGGNVYIHGNKDGEPFKVGIQNPSGENGGYIGIYPAMDQSIVTSGIYERYFEEEGRRYHHILSTETGYPVDNGLVSVTIISKKSIDGDALSTTVFALGLEKGMTLIESLVDVDAIIVNDKNEIYLSKNAKEKFQLTDKQFIIKN